MTDYLSKTLDSLVTNCKVRGIPDPEIESVRAEIAKRYGDTPLDEMDESQLRRVNRDMGLILTTYLDGEKRRPEVAPETDAEESAAEDEEWKGGGETVAEGS